MKTIRALLSKVPFLRYLVRRLVVLFIALASAMTVLFILLRIIPGDPSNALLPIGATASQIEAAKKSVGTDIPLLAQFYHWVSQLLSFNFGKSLISDSPVGSDITARLKVTIPLTLLSFTLAVLISAPLGFIAAYKSRTWYGNAINSATQFGIAIPVFWIGLILIYVFALKLMILPAGGFPASGWADPVGSFKSLLLPIVTIAIAMSASLTRYVRSATLDVISSDFLRTSRSLGFSISQSMRRHALRNAVAPVISILGIELATTFVGAVVVESVFALPGLGSMLVKAITEHDYPVIQGVLFLSTLGVMLIGFLADALQKAIDPRLNKFSNGSQS